MSKASHPYFIPVGEGGRRATATLLVGTADEFGIDQHDIERTVGGYNVTEALARAIYGDDFAVDPDATEPDTQFVDLSEPEPAPDYSSWTYSDLKSAVATRGIEVTDQKTETLVAALIADDAAKAVDPDETTE